MSELSQPHDRFFSKVFSNMETVEDILVNNVPPIANLLVLGTLEDCREKFVNPELEKYYSDLFLKAQLKDGREGYIYILLEHKRMGHVFRPINAHVYFNIKKTQNRDQPQPVVGANLCVRPPKFILSVIDNSNPHMI